MKLLTVFLISPAIIGLAMLGTVPAVVGDLLTPGVVSAPPSGTTMGTSSGVTSSLLTLYVSAAATCPGLTWTVLAAIGSVESGGGTSDMPGVRSGANPAGAEGPMQFEPATFAAYDRPVPPGGADPPSPYDMVDAVYAAVRLLCAAGGGTSAGISRAVFDYNHSLTYVAQVLALAASFGSPSGPSGNPADRAVSYALAQVGTPYRWGGESPGLGFDCSGLVQAAWAAAGVSLPRVASAQFAAGPQLVPGAPLQDGDLVFFGPRVGDVTHVGMVIDPSGVMVDAPHTGATVRVEPFPDRLGAGWGSDIVLGFTEP